MNTTLELPPPLEAESSLEPDRPLQRKVLLLEDDTDLKGILAEYLEEHDYEVVSVANGVEGVREVMKTDFETIVCDMNMPSLPGDMFYLAVQRMKPQLCSRFLFITGQKGSPRMCEFISKVRGTMLAKPFRMEDLLEMIGFVQMRGVFGV